MHGKGKENRHSNKPSTPDGQTGKKESRAGKRAPKPAAYSAAPPSPRRALATEPVQKVVERLSLKIFAKKPPTNYADIESNLWKNNIMYEPRKKVDHLDVSNEDFSKYETTDLEGNRTAPSTFNIFRDSLSKNTAEINKRMIMNLPDMNLHEVESDASDSDAEIVPLEFRTAIVPDGKGEKLVI